MDKQAENASINFTLTQTENGLALCLPDTKSKPFIIDFTEGAWIYRLQQASLRKEAIARAMGSHPNKHPRIIDATAGLGRDSFLLAALGFHVTLLERSTIVHALLKDALERARANTKLAPIVNRMELHCVDACDYLSKQQCDIVYLDPMFPAREKTAQVKKEMVILQTLLGKDSDTDALFRAALTCATQRIVVKRPRLAAGLTGIDPSFSLTGKSSRFDVYLRAGRINTEQNQ